VTSNNGIPWHQASRLGARIARSSFLSHSPFKATLALTHKCPCHCRFCGIWKRKDDFELPADLLLQALASVPSLTWLDLTGGEIFARQDLGILCDGLPEALPSLALFHFPTSGAWPQEAADLARKMTSRGVKVVVSVSVDGPPALHDRLRGVPGLFLKAIETIRSLRTILGVEVYIGTTILPENINLLPDGIAAVVRSHIPGLPRQAFHVNVMQRSDHYFSNDGASIPDAAKVAAVLKKIVLWHGFPTTPFSTMEQIYRLIAIRVAHGAVPPRCRALSASLHISPDGTVYPCHIWGEPIGRIDSETTLADLLSDHRTCWLRKQIAAGSCPQCWTPCEAYPTMISRILNP
jgi:MoaA/NifB/PqqE/SkfB family radical SAM enzyme